MGILDALKGLTRPYDEEEDFFDDEELMDEEEQPQKSAGGRASANPFFDSDTPEYDSPEEEPAPAVQRPSFIPRTRDRAERDAGRSSRMGNAGGSTGNKIVFMKPDRYEDTKVIFDHLRARRIVLMSLDETNKEIARRILDVLSGAAYAMRAKIKNVSVGTYLIIPYGSEFSGEGMDTIETDSFKLE